MVDRKDSLMAFRLVDTLKSEGRYFEAGKAAYADCPTHNSYGCHFGMRSSLAFAKYEFARGFAEAMFEAAQKK